MGSGLAKLDEEPNVTVDDCWNQVVTVDGNPSWCWILWKGEGSQKFALKFCEDIKQNDSKMWDDGWLCCSVA